MTDLEAVFDRMARRFPADMVEEQLWDLPRIVFNTRLIVDRVGTDVSVCDIGAGVGDTGPIGQQGEE